MMNSKFVYIALLFFSSCTTINHAVTRIAVGLSMKEHKISDEEIIELPKKYFSQKVTIGKFEESYFREMLNDSSLYNIQNAKVKSKYSNFIVQPLNCMFFDESNKLIAAYSICDADLVKTKLSWNYYLSKRYLTKNMDISHNVTFDLVEKYIEKLEVDNSNEGAKNVVLCWSKIGGRQTKNYLSEFAGYLSRTNYNIYIINCDEAMNNFGLN